MQIYNVSKAQELELETQMQVSCIVAVIMYACNTIADDGSKF